MTIDALLSRESFLELAATADDDARIPVAYQLEVEDPYRAYRRARSASDTGVYLETTGGQSGWSYFAVDPVEQIQASVPGTPLNADTSPSLAALTGIIEDEELIRGPCEVPYPCGLFGWFSYDLVRELESIPDTTTDDRTLPQFQFGLFDRVAAWREPRDNGPVTITITACPKLDTDPGAAYDRAKADATELIDRIRTGTVEAGAPPVASGDGRLTSEVGKSAYMDRVKRIKEEIRSGETFQVNISHRLVGEATVHPVEVYDALRSVNPAPYSGLLEFPGLDLVSASPELLLAVTGEKLWTEPIAGTRPRGGTAAADKKLAAELLADEKERAEHAMLVDLERNDLGKVARYGSVNVTEYRRVDRYSEVMHLVSLVTGKLRPDVSLAGVCQANPLQPSETSDADRLMAAIAAVFPGGTITGAPKPRTMEIIDELESHRRGPYTGSMAIIGFDQQAKLNIIIRTLVRVGSKYYLRVGAGIVHDSIPEREYDETIDKARALIEAVNEALANGTELEVA